MDRFALCVKAEAMALTVGCTVDFAVDFTVDFGFKKATGQLAT
jgi:hypothetical protein